MKIKAKQYAQALFEELSNKSEGDKSGVVERFVGILIKDNNVSQIEKIIYYFEKIWNKEYSIVEAELKTSQKVGDETRNLLIDYLKKVSEVEDVKITEKEDKKIKGGFVLKYKDKILDASIKNRLNSFKNNLLN
ncbi:MAG: F0F1 ATP synthase subunit delta [Patescibacteria group bacterium]